ncbi:hydrophobin 5 [Hyaloscypha variabilis]|uniref:Hydrophobin 5 n=1 Tax=Hyaloscypha variabilis (strain UAMH 11265 / GT02V1 / F) TaxID=1149755 RepID=A0A2J6SCX5_HYAVF|nr:hydrophobin 5 [Hyaloscypha variabilis F]
MKTSFTTFFVLSGLVASSLATPASRIRRQADVVCGSGTPNCCDVDVLGIADLDCAVPSPVPTSVPDFQAICAAKGKIDMCCTIDLLEQGLLCSSPV